MASYRTALVTGASSGIGAEIARVLADRGCALTLVARRADRLTALAEELRDRVAVDVLPADLSGDDGVAAVERRLADAPVELLVNDAGVGTGGTFHRQPIERELNAIQVNVVAVVRLTHAALPAMVAARHGGILNVSSLAGDQPLPRSATYCSTKAYVTMFSEAVAAEVRRHGVHVTVVKPGFTFTGINAGAHPDQGSLMGRLWTQPDQVARAAVGAVERGRLVCVPGVPWRAVHGLMQALPRPAVRGVSSRFG